MFDVAGVTKPISCLAQVQLWFAPFFPGVGAQRCFKGLHIGNFQISKFKVYWQYHLLSGSTSPDIAQVFVGSSWSGELLWQFCQSHQQSFQPRVVGTFVGSALFAGCPMQGAKDGATWEAAASSACQEHPDHNSFRADVTRDMLLNASSTVCETSRHLFQS